jgi:hypothetical protein
VLPCRFCPYRPSLKIWLSFFFHLRPVSSNVHRHTLPASVASPAQVSLSIAVPTLRNQPGHLSSIRGPHTFYLPINILIRSAGLQTFLMISLCPPSHSLLSLTELPGAPQPLCRTYFCLILIVSSYLPYSLLVCASRALFQNITRRLGPPCSQMVHQYTQGPITSCNETMGSETNLN